MSASHSIQIEQRLSNLSYEKLEALMQNIGKNAPPEFYSCLCRAMPHMSHVGVAFDPDRAAAVKSQLREARGADAEYRQERAPRVLQLPVSRDAAYEPCRRRIRS